ncbi:type II toxin-antitoxin system ParD family antitoxin [Methylomonas sp. SURF-2]|uniref:Antitoxin ParD n=1 Tax=Methylomonas subterranea TaxID=2952225 RepID=A0ABT1TH00_9GAMM|nr:type II toxin-antitoxin system ParD family antitoxin [Methylomonas sp. SURF-2]MCQ8104737.1 type II toxin-antitoxin system ParD family antitoxin [Methylomonas sp. SURF-2]
MDAVFCFMWCEIGAILVHNLFLKGQTMVRQSISISEPNDEWLKAQVASAEYSSKSEAINDLIRQARRRQLEIEHIRSELIKAEQSGFIDEQPDELLANFKEEARQDGLL